MIIQVSKIFFLPSYPQLKLHVTDLLFCSALYKTNTLLLLNLVLTAFCAFVHVNGDDCSNV